MHLREVIFLWPLGAVLLIGAIIACLPRLRRAYIDAWRCVARYPALWRIPAFCAAAYGCFEILALLLLQWRAHQQFLPLVAADPSLGLEDIVLLADSVLPATEQVAALLNCLPAPFPISSLAALVFLCNGFSSASALRRALRRRLPRRWAYLFTLVLLGALSALVRPVYTLALPEISGWIAWEVLLPGLTFLNALAFTFDYLFATGVQLYLMLTAWSWLHGVQFDSERMICFAARRLGSLIVWPLLIIGATLTLVHLPLLIQAFAFSEMTWQTEALARPAWALVLLAMPTMLIGLALRHCSMRAAFNINTAFLRDHAISYLAFLLGAFFWVLSLHALGLAGARYFGDSLLGQLWLTGCQALTAAVAGWQLTVWVCFYSRPRKVLF